YSSRRQMFVHPGAGEDPVAADGAMRRGQNFGDLVVRESRKELQLNDLGCFHIRLAETLKQVVNHLEITGWLGIGDYGFIQRNLELAAPVRPAKSPAMINQDTAHLGSGHRHEVGAVPPI